MSQAKPTLAVVGATGVVGLSLLSLLPTRDDVWGEIRPIALGPVQRAARHHPGPGVDRARVERGSL